MKNLDDDADDEIVWGAPAIAKIIKKSDRATYSMLYRNRLPAQKVGGQWQSTVGALRRRLRPQDV